VLALKVCTDLVRGPVNTVKNRAAIPRDLNRLEEWANKTFMKFSKDKYKALLLGRNKSQQRHRLRTACLGSSSVEKNQWDCGR